MNHDHEALVGSSSSPPSSSLPATSMASPALECPSPAETSAMLAKEMNQLSMEEREKVLEDVHGIARVCDEPPEFLKSRLVLLERELENIPNKTAYDLANAVDNTYVEIEKLRLLFLRAESFDPRLAAYRMQLGEPDRAGRKIIAMFPKLKIAKTHNNALRAYYYVVMRCMANPMVAMQWIELCYFYVEHITYYVW